MDTVLITVNPEYGSLEGVVQLLPTLKKVNKTENAFIVFNRVGSPGFFDVQECWKVLKSMTKQIQIPERIGSFSETDSIIKHLNSGKNEIFYNRFWNGVSINDFNDILCNW